MRLLYASSRSSAVLVDPSGDYNTAPYHVILNGRDVGERDRTVLSLFNLLPDAEYALEARRGGECVGAVTFRTAGESFTLDVRRFGAVGDGVHDDTAAIQAAILCCPPDGRVRVGAGDYRIRPLFLKSHITLELKRGASLRLIADRSRFPILPGAIPNPAGEELLLGSAEGNPLDTYASALNGIGVEDVNIIGEGTVDGCAQFGDWWIEPKRKRGAYRGHLLYLRDCRDVTVHGISFRNSPSWNLHPCFSDLLRFIDIDIEAPFDSPNTDGFDPQSCRDVKLYGAKISVGDDCVAIKSGKLYMGMKYRRPSADIEIAWCAMLNGHGGVTVGSEMSGGVYGVRVHHCAMRGNDRGLRIKTRRRRGKYAVVDDVRFEDVRMAGVKAPLVVNALYFCDPDGHSDWVQSRDSLPADDTTPTLGSITFARVKATDCHACAAYVLGLLERPVECLRLENCDFAFAPDAEPMQPAMADGVIPCRRRGVIARNVERVELVNVSMDAVEGARVEAENVGEIMEDGNLSINQCLRIP